MPQQIEDRIQQARDQLSQVLRLLEEARGDIGILDIRSASIRSAFERLRRVESELWMVKRQLNHARVDRFVLYEIQDILVNPTSDASLPNVLASLRTISRLLTSQDSSMHDRVDSDIERVVLPGISQIQARIEQIANRLASSPR